MKKQYADVEIDASHVTDEWLAGFFDAEGHIGYTLKEGTPNALKSTLVQKLCPKILHTVRERLDHEGSFTPDGWCLVYYAQNAERFVRRIAPYVVSKRDQVDVALRFINTQRERPLTVERRQDLIECVQLASQFKHSKTAVVVPDAMHDYSVASLMPPLM